MCRVFLSKHPEQSTGIATAVLVSPFAADFAFSRLPAPLRATVVFTGATSAFKG
jgi:hypothetical protein